MHYCQNLEVLHLTLSVKTLFKLSQWLGKQMLKMILSNPDSDSWSTSSQLWKLKIPIEIIHHNTGLELPSSALWTICGTKSGKCLLFAYTPLDKGCFCCHQLTAVVESRENLWKRPGYNIWQIQSVWTYETTSTFCGSSLLTLFGEMDKDLGSNFSFTSVMGQRLFL